MFFFTIDNLKKFFLFKSISDIGKSSSILELFIFIPLFLINLFISLLEFSNLIEIIKSHRFLFLITLLFIFKIGNLHHLSYQKIFFCCSKHF